MQREARQGWYICSRPITKQTKPRQGRHRLAKREYAAPLALGIAARHVAALKAQTCLRSTKLVDQDWPEVERELPAAVAIRDAPKAKRISLVVPRLGDRRWNVEF